ncbi:P-loop containing nucleoside triphosphate hydrolase protein [Xylaria digitata]|nr:P-loop containing nucleoside triphosphate hydrolase protein [Xylaria digitata]
MEHIYSPLTQRADNIYRELITECSGQRRILIAFAGPPGSGKLTIAAQVVQRINTAVQHPIAASLPMDGFHYTRAHLDTLPNNAEAHARRGASWTFDADGVVALLKILSASRCGADPVTVLAPSFDHSIKDPIVDSIRIGPETQIIIVEGNWLLLDREPWRQIPKYVDNTWFVDVDASLARQRIVERHIVSGIESTWETALNRADTNDLPNGDEVRDHLARPNIRVMSVEGK